jgi:uncharacterized protein (DUF1697 family)
MQNCIALFRGINVGGRHIVPMEELVAALEGIGLQQVRTYIQSGNVVFRSSDASAAELSEQVGAAVESRFGFRPELFLLTLEEFAEITASNPFPEAESAPSTLHLSFLASAPSSPNLVALAALRAPNERFALRPGAFFLHAPDGIGRSKLAAGAERHLGVASTTRNWRSVLQILALARQ